MFRFDLERYEVLQPHIKLPEKVRKFILPMVIEDILKGIILIQAKIHNIILSSDYLYGEIAEKIGTLKIDNDWEPYSIRPYEKRAYRNFEGTTLSIYTNPSTGFLPKSMIQFKYNNHYPMFELGNRLPDLSVSSIEYALDFFCKISGRPQNVRNLFSLFKHYLYSPRKRGTIFFKNRENLTYYFGRDRYLKMYERGHDNKRHDEGWHFKDLDRLRIEYTLKKNKRHKYGLTNYLDFILDCKFFKVINNEFGFRKFKENKNNLPKEWDFYRLGCKKREVNGFQSEYNRQKKIGNVKNLGRDTELSPYFDNLQQRISKTISSYDGLWKKRTDLILNQK